MDFNVTKMASSIYVVRANGWHAVDELKDIFDTPDMIRAIRAKYPTQRVIVYPDASGNSRKTVDASKSDIALLRSAQFEVRVNGTNPAVKDRIMSVNKQFEVQNLWVNIKQCPTITKNLEQQAYDDNGEPDKKAGFDHQNDATGYPIAYEFPIVRAMQRIKTIG
jgi:quinolinate synthase